MFKKTILSAALATAVLTAASPADADATGLPYDLLGAGGNSCAEYMEEVIKGENKSARRVFYSWAQGYLSAIDMSLVVLGGSRERDISGAADYESGMAYLQWHCSRNPTKTYAKGVWDYYMTFPLSDAPAP
jgi:hypothetical protein